MEDFDFNDTAPPPLMEQEFLMENLCIKKGRAPGGYEPPPTRSSAKRWKNIHEQNMMTRLNEMHIIKKQNAQMSKEAAREIIRKIPVELLAKEWLSKEDATVDMRAYLVDHILPTLILGVERLLKEVDEKGLSASNRFEPEFNPINFLAQYLMRNNPRFSNFAEASPYVRGLREVSEAIKQELFTFEDNRLARIKAETRRKRTDRETHEQQIREEKDRRHNQLISQFNEWTDFIDNKIVELSFLQNALRSFTETVEEMPADLQEVARFGHPLDPTDESGKTLGLNEFVEYISLFVEDLPFEVFQLFMDHMSKCAADQKASVKKEGRRLILANLFLICDYGVLRFLLDDRKLNLLDRDRILTLFEQFWDMIMVTKETLGTLRNPRRWPVIDVEEVDDILFDAWQIEPDGGIREHEIEKQTQLLEAIRSEQNKEIEINARRDKIAKETWKRELLEQKSAGYRAKLYKYNVTDFMNLFNYPLLDTMEAPLRYMDNTDGRLLKEHGLYASTSTKTARERSKEPCDTLFDIIQLSGDKSSDEKLSKVSFDLGLDSESVDNIQRSDQVQSERETNTTKKMIDKNTNSRIEDLSLGETSSIESIDKNNNVASSDKNSSEDSEYAPSSYSNTKGKFTSRTKKRVKRVVRFRCASEESSEETEVKSKPLKFIRPLTPLSNEDEVTWQRPRSHSLSRQSLQKHESFVASVGHNVHRLTNVEALPPIPAHINVTQGQRIWNEQITDGECAEREKLIMMMEERGKEIVYSDHVRRAEKTKNENETMEEKLEVYKNETLETNAANVDATDNAETTDKEDVTVEPKTKVDLNLATKLVSIEGLDETTDAEKKAETKMKEDEETRTETDASVEIKLTGETDVTTEQNAEMLDIQSKNEDYISILPSDEQKIELLSETVIDEKSKCTEDNKENLESDEASKGLSAEYEKTDDARNVFEAAFNEAIDINKTESELEDPEENGKNKLSVKESADMDIMKELLANQEKLLQSMIASTGTLNKPDSNKTNVKNNCTGVLDNANLNRNVDNININSCFRTREIIATNIMVDLVHLSAYSVDYLNLVQFVQLVETFIGPYPSDKVFASLVHFITNGYHDTEPEKTDKLLEARDNNFLAKKRTTLNNLFEKWDNDGSGFLEIEAVTDVMFKFKDGQEVDAIRIAQSELKKQSEYNDNSLSKDEFRQFINLVTEELPGKDIFDLFVEFLMNSVERSYAERIRGEARKKWLQQINMAAKTSGTSMEPVYKAVFQALYKDAETHGDEKMISASIAMLETNKLEPSRGELLLRYAACTPEDCQYMLGKPLYKNMKGVSFQAVDTGKPVHVPRVASHGNVYFWNYDRLPKDRSGSFIAVPLKDKKKRVFGVLGVDTMIDTKVENLFIGHEINFFQGVAKAFSIAYHYVERKRKFLRVLENAILWFNRRCPHIKEITVFFVEPSLRVSGDYVLRKMMVKDLKGAAVYVSELIRLERKDNFFCKYLFDCMESSLTIVAEVHESRHLACPIRDNNGITVCILDFNTENLKILPYHERREAQRILRLLQKAHRELTNMAKGGMPNCILEAEQDITIRVDLMFERLMLEEVCNNISTLDPQSFAEIKGYYDPPRPIYETLRATIAIFKVDQVGEGDYDKWRDLKHIINIDLVNNIKTYDPTAACNLGNAEKLEKYLKAVTFAEVVEHGSIAAQQLYNWVQTCLSLIEFTCRMKENAENNI